MTAMLTRPDADMVITDDAEEIHIMECPNGKTITWRESAADEVIAARDAFDMFSGKGYFAYAPNADNTGGVQLTEFDQTVPRILYTAQLTGG